MQVKKFEAPTIQEALETIKRELGPEAIILHTKQNKRAFGLMSKASVEVTAAVSDRSLTKKKITERRLPARDKTEIQELPANQQADVYDKQLERYLERKRTGTGARTASTSDAPKRRVTSTPYVDIADDAKGLPSRWGFGSKGATRAAQPRAEEVAGQAKGLGASRPAIPYSDELAKEKIDEMARRAPVGSPTLEEEVMHLKRMLIELKSSEDRSTTMSDSKGLPAEFGATLHDAFEQLVLEGLDKKFAFALVKKAAFELGQEASGDSEAVLDQLANEILQTTETLSPLSSLKSRMQGTDGAMVADSSVTVLALVGPTGVGKTTTIAKIASEALTKRGLKVGLVNLDNYKVGASEQLATYAKILNIPFRRASSLDEFKEALQDFRSLDLVVVDTTGRSQRDPEALRELGRLLHSVDGIRTQLVVSATTRDTELYDMSSRFSLFQPEGIIVSKLDEATTYGSIYNLSQRAKLPLLYFTTGQRVPEDIEEASRERLVSLLMHI